jgi:hypothetical protein
LKTLATKKLFYRKYPFKVSCYLAGASQVKFRGVKWILNRYNGLSNEDAEKRASVDLIGWRSRRTQIDYPELVLFAKTVNKWINHTEVHIRCEGSRYNLFCADPKLYKKMVKELAQWVTEVTRPETDEDLAFFTANGPTKVLVKELPHNAFKYKIVMKPSMTAEKRLKFNAWLERYELHPKAISGNTKAWLSTRKGYVQDPFFYIENDEMLTMVNLYLGNIISRTEEFVLKDESVSA